MHPRQKSRLAHDGDEIRSSVSQAARRAKVALDLTSARSGARRLRSSLRSSDDTVTAHPRDSQRRMAVQLSGWLYCRHRRLVLVSRL